MFNQLANNKMNLDDADGKKISLDDVDDKSMRLDDADEQSSASVMQMSSFEPMHVIYKPPTQKQAISKTEICHS